MGRQVRDVFPRKDKESWQTAGWRASSPNEASYAESLAGVPRLLRIPSRSSWRARSGPERPTRRSIRSRSRCSLTYPPSPGRGSGRARGYRQRRQRRQAGACRGAGGRGYVLPAHSRGFGLGQRLRLSRSRRRPGVQGATSPARRRLRRKIRVRFAISSISLV